MSIVIDKHGNIKDPDSNMIIIGLKESELIEGSINTVQCRIDYDKLANDIDTINKMYNNG